MPKISVILAHNIAVIVKACPEAKFIVKCRECDYKSEPFSFMQAKKTDISELDKVYDHMLIGHRTFLEMIEEKKDE